MHQFTLSYRPGTLPCVTHADAFCSDFSAWCQQRGFEPKLAAVAERTSTGVWFWTVFAELPRGLSVPHLDRSGFWSHGVTAVIRLPRQVAALAAGWFAGLYARWPIRVPPEFLTHSRSSAPDTFGDSQ